MKKLLAWRPKFNVTRSASADVIAGAAGVSFTGAGFLWCPIAGLCVLGLVLLVTAWGVEA